LDYFINLLVLDLPDVYLIHSGNLSDNYRSTVNYFTKVKILFEYPKWKGFFNYGHRGIINICPPEIDQSGIMSSIYSTKFPLTPPV